MATQPMIDMERRMKGGQEYLVALRKLGFEPDAVLWAGVGSSSAEGAMELLMITSWTDNIGPKAIYDALFEAYDASATPKEIDPFIVSLFSPKTEVATDFYNAIRTIRNSQSPEEMRPIIVLGMMEYYTTPSWIVSNRLNKSTRFDDVRRFAAFQSNVAKLAA